MRKNISVPKSKFSNVNPIPKFFGYFVDCRKSPTFIFSVFLRNCTQCNVVVSCQQFRMRACHKMNVLLHSVTQPIIETSFKIKFGCFLFFYSKLLSQMKAAGLSPFMNCWYNIHDFSPNTDDSKPNYSYLTSAQVSSIDNWIN